LRVVSNAISLNMPTQLDNPREYQDIFHWAETQKDGSVPSFATRKNDPYEVSLRPSYSSILADARLSQYQPGFGNSFESEAVPGENAPKSVASAKHLTEVMWDDRNYPTRTE
jgi:homogentisate 1,2-dioxygenase